MPPNCLRSSATTNCGGSTHTSDAPPGMMRTRATSSIDGGADSDTGNGIATLPVQRGHIH